MRYPATEKLEIIRPIEHAPLPVRRALAKLDISRAPPIAGTIGTAKAGTMSWRIECRARNECGTAFRRRCATAFPIR
jgi:hypothetical protein